VAIEHNLVVLKRTAFDQTTINAGDQLEIVNFVGGGQSAATSASEAQASDTLPRRARET
jgi:hypothetical protein